MAVSSERAVMSELLTSGDGDRAMLPMEALSTSTEGVVATRSAGSGLILILNFFRWSSSSSDSSEEKKCDFFELGGSVTLRGATFSLFRPFIVVLFHILQRQHEGGYGFTVRAKLWTCFPNKKLYTTSLTSFKSLHKSPFSVLVFWHVFRISISF